MKTQKIKKGTYEADYLIKDLKHSLVNRDIVEKHSELFSKKISEFGWMSPVIIDSYGNIIEGHHRVLSAERLGLKTVPAYIVHWVNTSDLDEYQRYIISLNNSNRKWNALDYLKSFARNKKQYSFVFQKYIETKDIFSVGNVLNIFFNSGTNQYFKDGKSKIKDIKFSNFLFNNFLRLKKEYGSVKFQAFTINRVCSFIHPKYKGDKKEIQYIFDQLEILAQTDNPTLSSVEMIRPWLKQQLITYRKLKK